MTTANQVHLAMIALLSGAVLEGCAAQVPRGSGLKPSHAARPSLVSGSLAPARTIAGRTHMCVPDGPGVTATLGRTYTFPRGLASESSAAGSKSLEQFSATSIGEAP
jgi:hypothetical protein